MIAIIGGYGEAGINACHLLQKWGKQPLKIGGRNPEKGKQRYGQAFPGAVWAHVDMYHAESLMNFMKGCDLVLNCAGPSHKISRRIAQSCIENGVHLVDAGLERNLEQLPLQRHDLSVLYGAGAIPGLSGMLPLWFARQFDKVHASLSYTGMLDTFTPTAATDYLEGVLDETNMPLAAWQEGAMVKGVLKRQPDLMLPFFERKLTAYPIFDDETLHVAKTLKLTKGEWYLTVEGSQMASALDSAAIQYRSHPQETIEKLCRASALDMVGHQPYYNHLLQFEGESNGQRITKTVLLQAAGMASLTGAVAAACAIGMLDRHIAANGIQPASTADHKGFIIDFLLQQGIISQLRTFNDSIQELMTEEEGVL